MCSIVALAGSRRIRYIDDLLAQPRRTGSEVPVDTILLGEHTSLIRRWRPWERATGPKTAEGKARSAIRGYKGGERQRLRELRKVMREAEAVVRGLQGGSETA